LHPFWLFEDYVTQSWAFAAAEVQTLIHDPLELFERAVRLVPLADAVGIREAKGLLK